MPEEDTVPVMISAENIPVEGVNDSLTGNGKTVLPAQENIPKENKDVIIPGEKTPVTISDIKKLLEEMETKNYSEKELTELKQILIKFMAEKGR